jgi:hypothetical protein
VVVVMMIIMIMIIKKLPMEANKEIRTLSDWSPCFRSFAERNNGVIDVPQLASAMKVTSQNYLVFIFCKMEHPQTVTNRKHHPTSIMM